MMEALRVSVHDGDHNDDERIKIAMMMMMIKIAIWLMMMMIHHRKHCRGSVHCRLSSREGSKLPHSSHTLDPLQKKDTSQIFLHFRFLSDEVVC